MQMVKHTVHIIASVASNTTLQINDDFTIAVDDAPTSLDLVTTYDTESTSLSMINPFVTHAPQYSRAWLRLSLDKATPPALLHQSRPLNVLSLY